MEKRLIKVAEIKQKGMFRCVRCIYSVNGLCPTINACQGGNLQPKIMEETSERFYRQAIETARENECKNGDIIDAFNKKVIKDGVSPTITTRPEGFKTAILPIHNHRIRKLTPRECWRLMGFSDEDFDKAKSAGISNCQLYKQAGNSIVVPVLEAIFKKMILERT